MIVINAMAFFFPLYCLGDQLWNVLGLSRLEHDSRLANVAESWHRGCSLGLSQCQ